MSVDSITDCLYLDNDIYLHEPTTLPPPENDDPSLVILFTWLGGASTRRVDKYVVKYRSLFPHAAIILVRSVFPDIAFRSFPTVHKRLSPARDATRKILARHNSSRSPFKGALLHIFSHGGCNMAIQFMISSQQENLQFPIHGMIIDCAPGAGTFTETYRAAAYSLPEGTIPQFTGRAILIPIAASITTLQTMRIMSSIPDLRNQLNDPTLFPTTTKRLYLYSNGDLVVTRKDVESHISDARTKGYDIDSVLFEGSPHCAILNRSEERYTAAITDFWSSQTQSRQNELPSPTKPSAHSSQMKPDETTSLRSKL